MAQNATTLVVSPPPLLSDHTQRRESSKAGTAAALVAMNVATVSLSPASSATASTRIVVPMATKDTVMNLPALKMAGRAAPWEYNDVKYLVQPMHRTVGSPAVRAVNLVCVLYCWPGDLWTA